MPHPRCDDSSRACSSWRSHWSSGAGAHLACRTRLPPGGHRVLRVAGRDADEPGRARAPGVRSRDAARAAAKPAGWANLGLLLLRQQQIDEAARAAGEGRRARAAQRRDRAAAGAGREPPGQPRRIDPPLAARDRARPRGSRRRRTRWRSSSNGRAAPRTTRRRSACSRRWRRGRGNLAAQLEYARLAAQARRCGGAQHGARRAGRSARRRGRPSAGAAESSAASRAGQSRRARPRRSSSSRTSCFASRSIAPRSPRSARRARRSASR